MHSLQYQEKYVDCLHKPKEAELQGFSPQRGFYTSHESHVHAWAEKRLTILHCLMADSHASKLWKTLCIKTPLALHKETNTFWSESWVSVGQGSFWGIFLYNHAGRGAHIEEVKNKQDFGYSICLLKRPMIRLSCSGTLFFESLHADRSYTGIWAAQEAASSGPSRSRSYPLSISSVFRP